LIIEVVIRVFVPQPVSYFAFPRTPEGGAIMSVMGKTVTLNSYGSRDMDYPREKSSGVTRIAVLGDSITFGFGVELEDSYHKVLEKKLNEDNTNKKYEVPSFNMGATDIVWAMNKYLMLVHQFHPDIVILGFCLRNIEDYSEYELADKQLKTKESFSRKIIRTFLDMHYFLRLHSHLYFLTMERSKPFLYRHFLDIRSKGPHYWIPIETDTPEYKRRFESTSKVLVEFNRIVKKDGARFLVVVFPYEIQLSDRHVELYEKAYRLHTYSDAPQGEVQKQLAQFFVQHGIEYIDLLPSYRSYALEHPDTPLFFRSIVGVID
jgi:hypothetical protein